MILALAVAATFASANLTEPPVIDIETKIAQLRVEKMAEQDVSFLEIFDADGRKVQEAKLLNIRQIIKRDVRVLAEEPEPQSSNSIMLELKVGDDGTMFLQPVLMVEMGGAFEIAQSRFELGAERQEAFQMITSPKIRVVAGQLAKILISAPVQYMEVQKDGRFSLITMDDGEGVSVEVAVRPTEQGVKFETLQIVLKEIVSREPVDGVLLDIGKPVTRTSTLTAQLDLPRQQVLLVPIQPVSAESGQLFILISAVVKE
ncbi:MAG: hypothetical protein KF866_07190 [Phycisphaeraceae bacterium]|nr:hypothetical protein [Phycisphaeraceae bacterium]